MAADTLAASETAEQNKRSTDGECATAGSFFYGAVAEVTSWTQNYALMGLIVFLLLLTILMYRTGGHPEKLLEPEESSSRHMREIHRH